jgi:flavin reductase (DIM6/NTAB) family NADH-FMN oxidoreductase RutF
MFSSDGPKDSATFAEHASEFVWNMVTYDLREAMNQTSAALPRGENEFHHAGLEMAPSRLVAPPRVAASPVAFECRVIERVRQRLADVRFEQIDPAMRVTFSAGIAQCQVGETLSALIERADQAMYAAKQGGRDRSVISEAPVAVPRLRLVASQREGVPS